MTRTVSIDGVLEEFTWAAPHSLVKVRGDDARLYTAEWRAPNALIRAGITQETLAVGERVVVTGNPRRDFAESGIVNFKAISRPRDGWKWPS
jgi:hypothetical protein